MDASAMLIEEAKKHVGEFRLSKDSLSAGSVSAALITSKGSIYSGICLDLDCGIGFCAEHAAIAAMLKNRETEIDMIVAVDERGVLPPCGRCRELMQQIDARNRRTKVVLSHNRVVLLEELLPHHWLERRSVDRVQGP